MAYRPTLSGEYYSFRGQVMTRISKREAFKRFVRGEKIILCPVKLRPGLPFAPHSTIYEGDIEEYRRSARRWEPLSAINEHSSVWKGDIDKTAWGLMYNNWAHYNTSYEAGYYAAYYVD